MTADRTRLLENALFWGALTALTALSIAPYWVSDLVPAADLPAHLGKVAMLRHIVDPEHYLARFYATGEFPFPNFFYYGLTWLLSFPFGLLVANQLVASLYVVVYPLCVLVFLRAFGRSRWLVFLAYLLLWNRFTFYGFIDYIYSMPFMLLGLAMCRWFSETPTRWRFAGATAVGLLLYCTHLQSFVTYCFLATLLYCLAIRWPRPEGLTWAAHAGREIGRLALRGATLVPSVALTIPWIIEQGVLPSARADRTMERAVSRFGTLDNLGGVYDPFSKRVGDIVTNSLEVTPCNTDHVIFFGFVLLLIISLVGRRAEPSERGWLYDHALEVVTGLAVVFYFILPTHMTGLSVIHHRLAPVVLMLMVGWFGARHRPLGSKRLLTIAVLAVWLSAYRGVDIYQHAQLHARHAEGLLETVGAAEPHTRMLNMIPYAQQRGRVSFVFALFRHVQNYHVVLNEGAIGQSFAKTPGRLVVLGDERVGTLHRQTKRWPANRTIARNYHYVLSRRVRPADITRYGMWTLAAEHGDWSLYQSTQRPLSKP